MQSVPITTNVVSSKLVHGEMYSIQDYVMMFASDMRQAGCFESGVKHDNPNPRI